VCNYKDCRIAKFRVSVIKSGGVALRLLSKIVNEETRFNSEKPDIFRNAVAGLTQRYHKETA
jgi:hypothetical protein